jgi:hypothetical protein
MYRLHGFAEQSAALAAAFAVGSFDAALAAVSDEMIDTFAIAGRPDDVLGQGDRWRGVIDTLALLPAASAMSYRRCGRTPRRSLRSSAISVGSAMRRLSRALARLRIASDVTGRDGWTRLETGIRLAAQLLGGSSKDAVCAELRFPSQMPIHR